MLSTTIPIARPNLGAEEEAAVLAVMRSGHLAQGEQVRAFEGAFSHAVGSAHGIATSNGSTALYLALRALGIGTGHEVITTPLTFIASANAIIQTGALPVFADVDDTLNIDPEQVESLITPRTRALLPVHLHGNPADLSSLGEIARRRGIHLVQDACQAHDAKFEGQPLGFYGTACYSFYATKNITTGEGGMVLTNDEDVATRVRSLRHQGYHPGATYLHDEVGFNYRITEIQAAIGVVQVGRMSGVTESRRATARYYDSRLPIDRFPRPRVLPPASHAYHQYVIRLASLAQREALRLHLERAGIGSGVHYPVPVHRQPAYSDYADVKLPRAEVAANDMLSLPVHPAVAEDDRRRVVEALLNFPSD